MQLNENVYVQWQYCSVEDSKRDTNKWKVVIDTKMGLAEEWWSHTVDIFVSLMGKVCGVSYLYFVDFDEDTEKEEFSPIANKQTSVIFYITIIIIYLNSIYLYI